MAEAGADLTLASFEHFPLAQFWECSSPDGWRVRLERRADLLPVPEHSFCLLIVRIVDFNRQARKWAASSTLLD